MLKLQLKYQLLFVINLLFINLFAQKSEHSFGVKETIHFGQIAQHRPIVGEIIEGHSWAYEFSFYKNTFGKTQWQQAYNYPSYGVSVIYLDLANPEEIGRSYGVFPYVSFITKNRKISWELKFGYGVGYIEKPFDRTTNIKNLAIGSSINALINLNSQWSLNLSDRMKTSMGLSLIHLSNGSFKRPNLGINILSLNWGLAYQFGEVHQREVHEIIERDRKWQKNITVGFGLKEIAPIEGPKYLVNVTSFNVMKIRSNKSSFGAGLDFFYNSSLSHVIEQDTSLTSSNLDNYKGGVTLIYSLDFGKISTVFQMGGYFFAKEKAFGFIYHRIITRYHFNDKLFFNLGLNTHFATADFVEVGLGYNFN